MPDSVEIPAPDSTATPPSWTRSARSSRRAPGSRPEDTPPWSVTSRRAASPAGVVDPTGLRGGGVVRRPAVDEGPDVERHHAAVLADRAEDLPGVVAVQPDERAVP